MGARRILAGLGAVALVLGACGGDDGDDGASGGDAAEETTTAPDDGGGDGGGAEGTCDGTDLEVTNLTTGTTFAVTDTAAVSLQDGAAYTAYLADFEIDPAEVTAFASPTVPEGANMATLFITVFNAEEVPEPIEAGTEIEYTPDFGVLTFGVVLAAGAEQFGTNTGAEGTATVTAVGDVLCVEVDYADGEKTVAGTFEAEVTDT
jgi:hypothetical protein